MCVDTNRAAIDWLSQPTYTLPLQWGYNLPKTKAGLSGLTLATSSPAILFPKVSRFGFFLIFAYLTVPADLVLVGTT